MLCCHSDWGVARNGQTPSIGLFRQLESPATTLIRLSSDYDLGNPLVGNESEGHFSSLFVYLESDMVVLCPDVSHGNSTAINEVEFDRGSRGVLTFDELAYGVEPFRAGKTLAIEHPMPPPYPDPA